MYKNIFNSPQCKTLREKLDVEYKTHKVFPPRDKIFAAFELCPLDEVKVVILGQDPYHGEGQAVGLAFSVDLYDKRGRSNLSERQITPSPFVAFPPSLKNIIKEVRAEMGSCAVEDGDLRPWACQGVLLLNTCLTVRAHQPLSHAAIGWDGFFKPVIQALNQINDIVFVLWGSNARAYKKFLTNPRNLILESAHPSPLSAHNGFFGCGHFKKINEFLTSKGKNPIVF